MLHGETEAWRERQETDRGYKVSRCRNGMWMRGYMQRGCHFSLSPVRVCNVRVCESESVHYADADGGGETGWNICISNTPSWMLQHQPGVARLGEARRRDGSDGMFETYGIRTEKAAVGPIQCTNSTLKVSSRSIQFQRIATFSPRTAPSGVIGLIVSTPCWLGRGDKTRWDFRMSRG